MQRKWKVQMNMISTSPAGKLAAITVFETYEIGKVTRLVKETRIKEEAMGLPKRRLNPIARYILEDMIDVYWRESAPKGYELAYIQIEDNKPNGL